MPGLFTKMLAVVKQQQSIGSEQSDQYGITNNLNKSVSKSFVIAVEKDSKIEKEVA